MTNLVTMSASFEDILDELEQLSRNHLLMYRVQVGAVLLRHFWSDDPAIFASHDPQKNVRFGLFFTKFSEALQRYGLSKHQAYTSVRAHLVVRALPPAMAEQLFLSQVLELVRLADPTLRAKVAGAAIARDWSVTQLRDAVTAVRAGLSIDEGDGGDGLAPPQVVTPPRTLAPGRLVTRAERMVSDMDTWAEQWSQVDVSRLRRPQRLRLQAAVVALEARAAALRVSLGEGAFGAETAGAETAGAETAGAETAGAETAGAETAGADS